MHSITNLDGGIPGPGLVIRRNVVPSPFGVAALAGYGGLASMEVITGNLSIAAFAASPVPTHPSSGMRVRLPANAPTGGGAILASGLTAGDWVVSAWAIRQTGPATSFGFALRGSRALGASRTFSFNTWTYIEESFTISAAEASAGGVIGWRSTVTDTAQSDFYLINMQVAPAGEQSPSGDLVVAGGVASSDPELTYEWTGTPNGSTSIVRRRTWNVLNATRPLAVAGYAADRRSRNVIHDLLDGTIGVSFVPPRPRSGTLVTVYDSEVDAFAALTMYGAGRLFRYANDDLPALGMDFALDGQLGIEQDSEATDVWYVLVGYQEV